MIEKNHALISLVGRLLLALLFVISGFGKITGYDGTAGYMASHGMPLVSILLPLTILTELGGGLALMLGIGTRWVALLLFLFLIPVTLIFHSGPEMEQHINFLKNLSIMGGMLLLAANGPGRWSIDGRRGA